MIRIGSSSRILLDDQPTRVLLPNLLHLLVVEIRRKFLEILHRKIHQVGIDAFRDPFLCHLAGDVQDIKVLRQASGCMMAHEEGLAHSRSCHHDIESLARDTAVRDRVELLNVEWDLVLHPVVELVPLAVVFDVVMSDVRVKGDSQSV